MAQRKKQANKSSSQSASSGWGWLLAGIMAGLLMAGLLYFYRVETTAILHGEGREAKSTVSKPAKPVAEAQAPKSPKLKEPQFDFYNLLSKGAMEEPAPQRGQAKPAPATAAPVAAKKHYILQVAALNNHNDADQLKAQLTLTGFAVTIKPFNKDGRDWYRVIVGPYSSENAAKSAQQTLKEQKVTSFIATVK